MKAIKRKSIATLTPLSLVAATLASTACTPNVPGVELRSSLQRALSDSSADEVKALADNNNAFAFDLYQKVRDDADNADQNDNIVFSPYSTSLALAMLYAGAKGTTEAEMASTLYFSPQDQLHGDFNALDAAIREHAAVSEEPFDLRIVNDLWSQTGFEILPSYLDTLAVNYGAGVRAVDFAGNPEAQRIAINDYIAGITESRIKDLLPEGAVNADTRLTLTNAIYFNAKWDTQFDKDSTQNGLFNNQNGDTPNVSFMNGTGQRGFAVANGFTAVELPYSGQQLAMTIVMPDGDFAAFEDNLSPELWEQIDAALTYTSVDLQMPKFTFNDTTPLSSTLQELGMTSAFDGTAADFTGINADGGLVVQNAGHKAFILVDEAGTEAAAATFVSVGVTSAPEGTRVVLDRPFVFAIRDLPTGAVLFMGRVVNL